MNDLLSLFLLCIGASFIQRTTGFGFGIFIMTLLPSIIGSYGEATALSGILALTTSAIIAWRMRKLIVWKKLIPILVTFIVVSTAAIFILTRIEGQLLNRILGAVLILISIYFCLFSQRIKLRPTKCVMFSTGTLSGVMGGLFGMQGPPAVLYFITVEDDKDKYMATVQAFFLLGNLTMTLVRAFNGFVTLSVSIGYLIGLGGVFIGSSIGGYVFSRIPKHIFRYVVYAYIGISGLIIIINA